MAISKGKAGLRDVTVVVRLLFHAQNTLIYLEYVIFRCISIFLILKVKDNLGDC